MEDSVLKRFHSNVFPSDWKNPQPKTQYDLLIIGGGPGGMTAAIAASSMSNSVALIEKEHLGGECLSYGCIPSKALLRSSKAADEVRRGKEFGLEISQNWEVDFNAVLRRVHEVQATISPHDHPEHLKNLGIDVFLGAGRFIGPNEVEVKGQKIKFKKAIIATGTQPIELKIPNIDTNDYYTNQTIFQLTTLPRRFCVIGGGPIGCELSQGFLSLGSQVTLITHASSIIPRDDSIAQERLLKVFQNQGMKVYTHTSVLRIEKKGNEKILYLDNSDVVVVDEILVAIGRKPTVDGMDLEKANINYDHKNGIFTDDYLQTSNSDVYSSGDVSSDYKFTHVSKELSKMAAFNALKRNSQKKSSLIIPWCTYTEPAIAHIGINEQQANAKGMSIETIIQELSEVDRAVADGETIGFVKLLVKANTNQIVGATVMAQEAGAFISEISVAMQNENSLTAIAQAIHPFPTQSESIRMAAMALLKKREESIQFATAH